MEQELTQEQKDQLGQELIDICNGRNLPDQVKKLIEDGANVNVVNNLGQNALMYATTGGNPNIAALLIKAGANVNLVNTDGKSALMLAAEMGEVELVALLIKAGADIEAVDPRFRQNALLLTARRGNSQTVTILIKAGANVNVVDNSRRRTALMFAAERYDESDGYGGYGGYGVYGESSSKKRSEEEMMAAQIVALLINATFEQSEDLAIFEEQLKIAGLRGNNILNLEKVFPALLSSNDPVAASALNLLFLANPNSKDGLLNIIAKSQAGNSLAIENCALNLLKQNRPGALNDQNLARRIRALELANNPNVTNKPTPSQIFTQIISGINQIEDDQTTPEAKPFRQEFRKDDYTGQGRIYFNDFVEEVAQNVYCRSRNLLLAQDQEKYDISIKEAEGKENKDELISKIDSVHQKETAEAKIIAKQVAMNSVALILDYKKQMDNISSSAGESLGANLEAMRAIIDVVNHESAEKGSESSPALPTEMWLKILETVAIGDVKVEPRDQFEICRSELSCGTGLGLDDPRLEAVNQTAFNILQNAKISDSESCFKSAEKYAINELRNSPLFQDQQNPSKFLKRLSIAQGVDQGSLLKGVTIRELNTLYGTCKAEINNAEDEKVKEVLKKILKVLEEYGDGKESGFKRLKPSKNTNDVEQNKAAESSSDSRNEEGSKADGDLGGHSPKRPKTSPSNKSGSRPVSPSSSYSKDLGK